MWASFPTVKNPNQNKKPPRESVTVSVDILFTVGFRLRVS